MALNIYLIPREDHTSFFCSSVLLNTFFAPPQAIPLWVKLLTFCWHSVLNTLSEVKISIPVTSLLYGIAPPSSHSWSEYSFWYALTWFSDVQGCSLSQGKRRDRKWPRTSENQARYAWDRLSYYNVLLLGQARFQNLSMIWKLLLTLRKDIHYLEK